MLVLVRLLLLLLRGRECCCCPCLLGASQQEDAVALRGVTPRRRVSMWVSRFSSGLWWAIARVKRGSPEALGDGVSRHPQRPT